MFAEAYLTLSKSIVSYLQNIESHRFRNSSCWLNAKTNPFCRQLTRSLHICQVCSGIHWVKVQNGNVIFRPQNLPKRTGTKVHSRQVERLVDFCHIFRDLELQKMRGSSVEWDHPSYDSGVHRSHSADMLDATQVSAFSGKYCFNAGRNSVADFVQVLLMCSFVCFILDHSKW